MKPIPFDRIRAITGQADFIAFLRHELNWPIPDEIESFEPVAIPYDMCNDLGYQPNTTPRLRVSRLLALHAHQPWGVFLFDLHTPRLSITDVRKIVRKLSSRRELMRGMPVWNTDHILIIATTDWRGYQFIHLRGDNAARAEIRSFGWHGPDDGFLRTLCEYNLPHLRFPEVAHDLFGRPEYSERLRAAWLAQWQAAFDVKAVTDAFYADLSAVFDQLYHAVHGVPEAHRRHVAELLVNRLLFLSFVQKKGWLDGDPEYLYHHYARYRDAGRLPAFYKEFLYPLFFEALNNPTGQAHPALGAIPFLNGGLFTPSHLWNDAAVSIEPTALTELFERLLHRYNFTIRETDPLDVVVAFDQDLLGYAYEELIAFRHGQGAYYTPPTEVYLMCREALRAYLTERTEVPAAKIGQLAYGDDSVKLSEGQAFDLYQALLHVRVCDIAQGSGSFSVAMLKVLFKVFQLIAKNITHDKLRELCGTHEILDIHNNYAIKLHIIERSIYGCDIDEFAVEIARLRFWIELMVEMDQPAPLPNFDFKFVDGDALVSYWGRTPKGALLTLDTLAPRAPNAQADFHFGSEALQAYALAKHRFYLARTPQEKAAAREQIADLRCAALRALMLPHTPDGQPTDPAARRHVHWQLDFAEVFAHANAPAGFDIIIANPPYVRQELIDAAFRAFNLGISKADLLAAYQHITGFPKLDAKADLYVYFFYRALTLLKPQGGVFCFICSNSWLDVGYGAQLQEFILRHCEIRAIIDNSAKRSFASADVNTTINLFITRNTEEKKRVARFIMFRKPFEDAATEAALRKAYELTDVTTTPDYRVYPLAQDKLFEAGLVKKEEEKEEEQAGAPAIKTSKTVAKYGGDKWGGKYLRAPDIFFKILEKGKGKLVRLGDIAEVRFGIKTGCNEFFYLDEEKIKHWGIEPEFLKPVIKSPRECRSIVIKPEELRYKIFICHKEKIELKGTAALRYIEWGEKQGFHLRPSCRGRKSWWNLGKRRHAPIASPSSCNELYRAFINPFRVLIDKRLYRVYVEQLVVEGTALALNSTVTTLFLELGSRTGLGEGLLDLTVYEVAGCFVVKPTLIKKPAIVDRQILPLEVELEQPDRRALDEVVFDALGLSGREREEVYEAVVALVQARLNKARSV